MSFVNKMGWYILQRKKLGLSDYIATLALPSTPMDEIALVLIAQMYKVHIAFLMSKKFWATQQNHDISKCKIVLAYRGNLTFNDTRKKLPTPPPPPPVPKSVPSRYRLRSTTEKDKTQPTKDNSNVLDKPAKNQQGKVVVSTHGIPKAV